MFGWKTGGLYYKSAYIYDGVSAPWGHALLTVDSWTHLVYSSNYSGNETKVYENGEYVETLASKAVSPTANNHQLWVGGEIPEP